MQTKSKVILSSLVTIAAAGGVLGGTTYSLFTGNKDVNITITSGIVDIDATVQNLKAYSGLWDESESRYVDHEVPVTGNVGTFLNGGSVVLESDGSLTLDRISPMDKATFNISIQNRSDISAKYRVTTSIIGDVSFFADLNVTLDGERYYGFTYSSPWTLMDVGFTKDIQVEVSLPEEAGLSAMGKSVSLKFAVEAIQGNAHTEDIPTGVTPIYNATDLKLFGSYAQTTMSNANVLLMNDIDLNGSSWESIETFNGNFDGNNNTISNFIVTGNKKVGFFGTLKGTVENLTLDNVEVNGINAVGGIAGLTYYGQINNCNVINSTITSSVVNHDDGDKAGGITGRLSVEEGSGSVTNCHVENTNIAGYREVGSVIGGAYKTSGSYDITNNTAKDVTIICDMTDDYKHEGDMINVRPIVGNVDYDPTAATNVTINKMLPTPVDPEGKIDVSNLNEGDVAALPSSTVKLPTIPKNIGIAGVRNENGEIETKIDATTGGNIASIPNGAVFSDIILDNNEKGNYHGFQHAGKLTFVGCEINGLLFSYGNMEFIDCVFNQTTTEYNMWAYGLDVTYTNCVFNSYGKFINVYNEGAGSYTVTFNECTFNNLGVANKAAINVKETNGNTMLGNKTVINNCHTTGEFKPAAGGSDDSLIIFNNLVQVDDRTTSHGDSKIQVTYNSKVIYKNGLPQA